MRVGAMNRMSAPSWRPWIEPRAMSVLSAPSVKQQPRATGGADRGIVVLLLRWTSGSSRRTGVEIWRCQGVNRYDGKGIYGNHIWMVTLDGGLVLVVIVRGKC